MCASPESGCRSASKVLQNLSIFSIITFNIKFAAAVLVTCKQFKSIVFFFSNWNGRDCKCNLFRHVVLSVLCCSVFLLLFFVCVLLIYSTSLKCSGGVLCYTIRSV